MERAKRAVELAETLLREARAGQTSEERARAERLARLMEDPRGKELTIALTDQCFRSRRAERIADQLHYLLERYGAPRFMEWWERIGLTLGALVGQYLPSLIVPPIVARLRQETEALILPGEDADLRRYLAERRADGIRLNLNQLGEAILGEEEAARRLEAYLALLARDDVEYISVKVSSVSSQIELTAFRPTVLIVKARLRALYRQALRHHYRHPDGRVTPKFVNLDMEEYRDLALTVAAFQEVLDEDEFMTLPAGIVLQAYLPESHRVQRGLVTWALARRRAARRADQASHRQGRQPGDGADRGRSARVAAGAVHRQGRGRRQLQAHDRVRLPPRARPRRPSRHRQPQPLRRGPWARAARGAGGGGLGGVRDARGHGQPPGARGPGAGGRAAALRAGGARRGLPQRDRLPRAPARREHRARQLPPPRLRARAGLARLGPRARSVPGRLRAGGRAVGCAATHPGPRRRGGVAGGGRSLGALRERARHRLGDRRQPGLARAGAGRVARAAGRDGPAPDRGRAGRRRGGGRRARPLPPRAHRLSPCAGRPPAGEPRARRRPRRAASVGRPAGGGATAPARCRGARCSRGGAAIWSGP